MPRDPKYYEKYRIQPGEERIVNRHGQGPLVVRTQSEVAKILGISRQAVHQAERSALHKLRGGLLDALREINPELAQNLCPWIKP